MKIHSLVVALLLIGCRGGGAKTPPEAAPEVPPPTPTKVVPETPAPVEEQPVAEPAKEIPCGDKACKPPEKCITVVGRQPDSARKECWVPCGKDDSCPDGMKCGMIHDGPGKVCQRTEETSCGGKTCKAPEECISVVGSLPGSGRMECWVKCGKGGACPKGMGCTMIHDGPGRVCRKKGD